MATVFLAEDERLGRRVAIKRLHADIADDELVRRFRREAQLGASLNHPNIVAVYDIATDDEGVLIVMEYVDGHTLRDELGGGPMPAERLLPIVRGVADALDHAHAHGVLHRDVKPANVLLRSDGAVKLADLGIATAAEHSRITRTGSVLGTAAYLAPERLDGEAGDKRVDVYALAAVAFEALAGRKPVEGATPMEVARRVIEQPPPDLRDALPEAPPPRPTRCVGASQRDPAGEISVGGRARRRRRARVRRRARSTDRGHRAPGDGRIRRGRPLRRTAHEPPGADAGIDRDWPRAEPCRARGGRDRAAYRRRDRRARLERRWVAGQGKPSGREAGVQGPAPVPVRSSGSERLEVNRTRDVRGRRSRGDRGDFYARAARHDYQGAWSLVTPAGRAQLGGLGSFTSGQSTLKSISFPRTAHDAPVGDRCDGRAPVDRGPHGSHRPVQRQHRPRHVGLDVEAGRVPHRLLPAVRGRRVGRAQRGPEREPRRGIDSARRREAERPRRGEGRQGPEGPGRAPRAAAKVFAEAARRVRARR